MKTALLITTTIFLFIFSFGSNRKISDDILDKKGTTIGAHFHPPAGFIRLPADQNSFANYLHQLPLKPNGSKVLLYNGKEKWRGDVQAAVIDLEIGNRDLQQCADAVMRLRAEYLFSQKQFDKIHFNFTSGDNASFEKYAEGFRAIITGNKVSWVKKAEKDFSYKTFRNYLDLVFSYAGSLSLSKELKPVSDINDIQPGDVFIKGGSPGHAVIVVDVAVNKTTGKKIFMLAQSYMPAQQIHILKNPDDETISPWYPVDFPGVLETPEWTFEKNQLMRF